VAIEACEWSALLGELFGTDAHDPGKDCCMLPLAVVSQPACHTGKQQSTWTLSELV